jgi:polyhydroxybutyrate depolymerase
MRHYLMPPVVDFRRFSSARQRQARVARADRGGSALAVWSRMTISRWLLFAFLFLGASRASAESGVVRGRPFHFRVPAGNDGTPKPLVVVLHGIGVTGAYQQQYFEMTDLADQRGFFVAYPDGTRNAAGAQFWNGINCCQTDLYGPVDDVGFIDDMITFLRGRFAIDPRRIFIIAHSNGAFLANKYACERSQVSAMVTLSGAQYFDPMSCGSPFPGFPTPPGLGKVSVLHVHGTLDELVGYGLLGTVVSTFPTAIQTVASWTWRNGCFLPPTLSSIDLMPPTGNETDRRFFPGCLGAQLEFWTINGGDHIPNFYHAPDPRSFGPQALDWLFAHPGP